MSARPDSVAAGLSRTAAAAAVPCVAAAAVLVASAGREIGRAREAAAAGAGLWFAELGLLGPVVARGVWRDLGTAGLLSQVLLSATTREHALGLPWVRAARQLGAWTAPWWLFPCVIVGFGGWTWAEALGLVLLIVIYAALALSCGLLAAWIERGGRERPAVGILMLGLMTVPPVAWALHRGPLLPAVDVTSWLCRAWARATPMGALRPVWAVPLGDRTAPVSWDVVALWSAEAALLALAALALVRRGIARTDRWLEGLRAE